MRFFVLVSALLLPPVASADPTVSEDLELVASDAEHGAMFGFSVSGAGDVDGDGFDDVIVGAAGESELSSGAGAAYVYLGSSSGVDSSSEIKLSASDGALSDELGYSVAGAGDVNGDGYDDVIVAAPFADGVGTESGSVYVYLGVGSGIDLGSEIELTASDAQSYDSFGWSVAGAGDLDGDGFDEVVVGMPSDDDHDSGSGACYLYFGANGGVDASTEHKLTASDAGYYDYFGWSVSGAGDVDGDGFDDLIVGAEVADGAEYQSGSAYVYPGSRAGLDLSGETELYASDGALGDYYGVSVSGAGDLDGDGYDDVIVGAYRDEDNGSDAGAAYIYLGGVSGVDSSAETKLIASDGAADDYYGWSVSAAGDLDGDGYHDVIVGAYYDDDLGSKSGSAYLYFGGSGGVAAGTEVKLNSSDGDSGDLFGYSVSHAGDVNGDLAADLIVGARGTTGAGVSSGSAYLFVGQCGSPTWYADSDADGYGDASSTTTACLQPSGYVDNADDCDDGEALAWTGATELCDGADNDCDGTVDNDDAADAPTWYGDDDGDGYGNPAISKTACELPDGYADNGDDCDDHEALAWTGASEVCDGADNNCDGAVDDDDPLLEGASTWYADTDGDGYTDAAVSVHACEAPSGYAAASDEPDCDDADEQVHPGADEIADDGLDQDCDGDDLHTEPLDTGDGDGKAGCSGCGGGVGAGSAWFLVSLCLVARRRRE